MKKKQKESNKKETGKKQKKQRCFEDIIISAFLVLFVSVVCVKLVFQYELYQQIQQEQAQIQQQIEQAKEKTVEYQNQKEYYGSDAFIEKMAREQLGLVKSNEILYVNRAK